MNSDSAAAKFTKQHTFTGQVFFYLCDTGFPHLSICLAEGFKKLGIPFYSNINYWKLSPEREEYLFRYDPNVMPEDCSIVILNKDWLVYSVPFPENLFQHNRKYITVYLDDMDGTKPSLHSHTADNFDFIFKTHCDSGIEYTDNYRPWVFGLSNRILQETTIIPKFEQRKRILLANFRVPQDRLRVANRFVPVDQGLLQVEQGVIIAEYPLRLVVRDYFFPLIHEILSVDKTVDSFDTPPSDSYHYLQWQQTGRRHYPNYYERLKQSAACAAFGGWLVPKPVTKKTFVEWWDSWRFWESFAAGCVTFHVDLERYGALLPVMPENWQHYIGIDFDNIQTSVDRIVSEPGILKRISTEGRRWAIENYGPVPTAVRFLKTIGSYGFPEPRGSEIKDNSVTLKLEESVNDSLPINLREINLIVFPDWSVPEKLLASELERVVRAIATHQNKSKIMLLIDTTNVSEEEANLIISGVAMNLMIQEDLDVSDGPEISLITQLSERHREILLPRLRGRIVLEKENEQAIAAVKAANLPACEPESLSRKRAVQLETGSWALQSLQ